MGLEYFNLCVGATAAVLGLASVVALFRALPRLQETIFLLDLTLVPLGFLSLYLSLARGESSFDSYHAGFPVIEAGSIPELDFWLTALMYTLPLIGYVIASQARNRGLLGYSRQRRRRRKSR